MNTWRWKADNITDVTVAISDHYVWDASSVMVDTITHRRASMQPRLMIRHRISTTWWNMENTR